MVPHGHPTPTCAVWYTYTKTAAIEKLETYYHTNPFRWFLHRDSVRVNSENSRSHNQLGPVHENSSWFLDGAPWSGF